METLSTTRGHMERYVALCACGTGAVIANATGDQIQMFLNDHGGHGPVTIRLIRRLPVAA